MVLLLPKNLGRTGWPPNFWGEGDKTMLQNFRTHTLALEFYRDCEKVRMPHHIRSQYMRACLSVLNNLAEGSAKKSIKDRARFYEIALGSFRECQSMLMVLREEELYQKYDKLGASLYKLHKFTLLPVTR